ncbi:ketopantoate reductase family protein [Thauera propionica]|uniref:ketopantoate reductase family protein n=1 Tax=Thauera propionica TaxID=2019431 RepID=UPI0023F41062|nr:ketopantoate reductase family protein [Thauera propionica]MDD3675081.1 ketopantoate reductase family protein [Thauera propionica]
MRFVILGAGGLGSVIGGYLAKAGEDVTLTCRPAHAQAINANGLKISGVRGEHLVREHLSAVTTPDEATGEFDHLIILVKGKDTETALAQAEGLKTRCKNVFSLQNGIGKEERLRQWAGRDKVVGASTIEGGTLLEPGVVSNPLTTPVTAYFGELDGGTSPRTDALAEAFTRAGLTAKSVPNIMQVLWEKLVQIGTASGWSVSTLGLRLYFQDGLLVRQGAEHYVALAKDMLRVYGAMGYTPQNFYAPMSQFKELNELDFEGGVAMMMKLGERLKQQGMRGRTSMHEDVIRGKKTEVDFLLKPFLDKAAELNLQVPVLETVYRIVKTQDAYLD